MIVKDNIKIMKGVENLKIDILDFNNDSQIITYHVSNTPICQFDQHSRARIGVKFYDYKVSYEPEYVFYTHVYKMMEQNPEFSKNVFNTLEKLEVVRRKENEVPTTFNLMTRSCSYTVRQDMSSLKGQMSRRLKLCEEEFITGVHFLLRDKMAKMAIDVTLFVPFCDIIKKCDYSSADYLSNMFGCLFSGCGRWPSHTEFATFNESCTTPQLLSEQLDINIFKSQYEIENNIR